MPHSGMKEMIHKRGTINAQFSRKRGELLEKCPLVGENERVGLS